MAEHYRYGVRPSSTQESSRPDTDRVITQRGGITSPSVTSSSSDDHQGKSIIYDILPSLVREFSTWQSNLMAA
jgi:hypothetical protein